MSWGLDGKFYPNTHEGDNERIAADARWRQQRKQNELLEKQKKEMEKQTKELEKQKEEMKKQTREMERHNKEMERQQQEQNYKNMYSSTSSYLDSSSISIQDYSGEEELIESMLPDVIEEILKTGETSTTLIQQRFKVGYSRAGRIIDAIEELGMISEYEGAKPRKVLINKEDWKKIDGDFPNKEENKLSKLRIIGFCNKFNSAIEEIYEKIDEKASIEHCKIDISDFEYNGNDPEIKNLRTYSINKENNFNITINLLENNIFSTTIKINDSDNISIKKYYLPLIMGTTSKSCNDAIAVWLELLEQDEYQLIEDNIYYNFNEDNNLLYIANVDKMEKLEDSENEDD